jgi:hypothetical protein
MTYIHQEADGDSSWINAALSCLLSLLQGALQGVTVDLHSDITHSDIR